MTENDLRLLEKASYMIDDDDVRDLVKQADTEECRQRLNQIIINLYHREEARCGYI